MNKKQSLISYISCILLISTVTHVYNIQSMPDRRLSSPTDIHDRSYISREVEEKEAIETNLMSAILKNDPAELRRVIKKQPNIHIMTRIINTPDKLLHYTPLEFAIITDAHPEIIQSLINSKANVNKPVSHRINQAGSSLLMLAAQRKIYDNSAVEVVKQLIDFNANPETTDKNGKTALDYASNPEIRRLLSQATEACKQKRQEHGKKRAIERLHRIIRGIEQRAQAEIQEAQEAIKLIENTKIESTQNNCERAVSQQSQSISVGVGSPILPRRIYRGMELVQ